jgi:hypothetical protein
MNLAIAVAVREFFKVALEYLSRALLKQQKNNQIVAEIDEVKKSESEQDFKKSAADLNDLNRSL